VAQRSMPQDSDEVRRAMHADAFDRIGERYDEAFPHKEGQLEAGKWLVQQLPSGSRTLDVGCGTGKPTARQLVDAGLDVTGIDISEGMLRLARQNVPEATLLRLDMVDLEESLGPFDAVVSFFSLLMFPRRQIPSILRRFRDLLVPGGYFLLAMVEENVDYTPIAFLGNPVRVTGYPRGELRSIITRAGFDVVDLRAFAYRSSARHTWPEIQLFCYCRREERQQAVDSSDQTLA
jgi:cyclopropane fatty-acyl-phospholipid synthase-like methyltransferase